MSDADTDTGKILAELSKLDRRCGHIQRELGEVKKQVTAVSAKVHEEMVDRRDDDLAQTRELNRLQSKVLAKNAGAGAGAGALAVGAAEIVRWLTTVLGSVVLLSCSSALARGAARDAVRIGESECLARARTEPQREACHVAACSALRTIDRRSEDGRKEEKEEKDQSQPEG